MRPEFAISDRIIGPGKPAYVIAELSANHNGSFDHAVKTLKAMKESGADAVKVQTYTADTITIQSSREEFQIRAGPWKGRSLHELYEEAFMPWEWQPKLKVVANDLRMDFFSSPFDETAVDFLEHDVGVPAYKIASFEIVDLSLVRKAGATGKPLIISTGMATLKEITEAAEAVPQSPIALLCCTSAYPAPASEMRLHRIPDLAKRFSVPVGLSDHTLGTTVPIASVVLGASIIEKHFTLARSNGGPDSAFSLEPQEFGQMVKAIRMVEAAMDGDLSYTPSPKEEGNRIFRPSLFIVKDIKKGEAFTHENVRSIRPAHGLPPKNIDEVIGKTAAHDVQRGTPLKWEHVNR
jgi:N-acetylneuraminate synthase